MKRRLVSIVGFTLIFVSFVALETKGAPDANIPSVVQAADGSLMLLPKTATIHGGAVVENTHGMENIGWWTNSSCFVTWNMKVTKPGKFEVEITSSCDGRGGSEYTVSVGNESIKDTVKGSGGWDKSTTRAIGVLSFPKEGVYELVVRPLNMKGAWVMNLLSLKLSPTTTAPAKPAPRKRRTPAPAKPSTPIPPQPVKPTDEDNKQQPPVTTPAPAEPNEPQPTGPVTGTVTEISASDLILKIAKDGDAKRILVYNLTIFTEVFIAGKPAKIDDINKGMKITIVTTDAKNVVRIDAK